MLVIGIGVGLLFLGIWLYYFLLPQVDRPTVFDESWLVQCPHCSAWHVLTPFSRESHPPTHWYRCPTCHHKWSEFL